MNSNETNYTFFYKRELQQMALLFRTLPASYVDNTVFTVANT
jgi:hypothetical protein